MSDKIDVPLDTLFLSKVIASNTKPDGTEIDPNLLRRMSHPICQACHVRYKEKYPDAVFEVKCKGIYSEEDFEEIQAADGVRFPDDPMPLEDVREIFDVPYWAERNIVYKDDNGDLSPFKARWYQQETLLCTARHKVDRWGRGLGKAQPLDTPTPTPTGWRKFGDINPGDWVFDENGKPTLVTFSTDVMYDHPCYEIIFSDGSKVTADAEHLWETWTHRSRVAASPSRVARRNGRCHRLIPKPGIRTTLQIKNTLLHGRGIRVEHNHSIPVCGALDYSEQNLLIDPYVLGVWLGDGDYKGNGITSDDCDHEVMEELTRRGYKTKKLQTYQRYSIVETPYGVNFVKLLKSLGVWGNKHVPEQYIHSSISQRTDLLKGLMDTDGTIAVAGNCCFDNTNKNLSDVVAEITISLGYKSTKSIKESYLNGVRHKDNYRVQFTPYRPVFVLARKLSRQKLSKSRLTQWHRYIVAVNEVPSVPVKCIQVANPRSLYLTGTSCIPTHNTSCGVIEELHKAITQKNYEILVVCPADSQSEKWYTEIDLQLQNSPTLKNAVASQKQQPFKVFRFKNGSQIAIFTAGSASGRGANSIRSQSPRRIRLEEQDYLAEGDYEAIDPLINRYKNSEFHGSSTPTGDRGKFWQMCLKFPRYREFYFPINAHPDFNAEYETTCRQEAKTEERYRHEYLAEFSDPSQGVFKSQHVDAASIRYIDPSRPSLKGYDTCRYQPSWRYFMGVDWNGKGTGTRIRVIGFDPETKIRKCVAKLTIDKPGFTTVDSITSIIEMNKQWNCEEIYIDAGFGFAQDELIRLEGTKSKDKSTQKLKDVHVVDFGADLTYNRLVPKRDMDIPKDRTTKYIPEKEDSEVKRRTKPFMVEGAVMAFEHRLVEFSDEDLILDEQLRAYRIKSYSAHGWANTYEVDGDCGDHDLDAFMLALLAIEQKYGLFASRENYRKLAAFSHISGWGVPSAPAAPVTREAVTPTEQKLDRAGIPSRTKQPSDNNEKNRLMFVIKNYTRPGGIMAPIRSSMAESKGKVPSRTSAFKKVRGRGI